MTNRILKSILFAVTSVLLASLLIITGIMYQYFGNMQEIQLKDELHLVANAAEQLGMSYLEDLESEQYRLTLVADDGTVIFDSHADAASMDNHADREEIKEAMISGSGSSSRKSSTLMEQTVYEAMRLDNGSVLRISLSRATAFALVFDMIKPIAAVAVTAILLSIWLAKRMAKRIVEPLNTLDLEKPMENDVYEELSPLLHRIHAQHLEIEAQMCALKQKQDEFEQITANMKEALVLLDSKDRILSINPAARLIFGADAECIGKDFLNIDRSRDMHLALDKAKLNGHSDFQAEKKGKDYQFDLSHIDSGGNISGMVILAFDISDRVNAERNRREFTANVSHELKTPLQSIIGSAELMENGIVKTEDIPRFVGHIHKEAARLVYLIDDIIRLSQLDEGAEMPLEEVSLSDVFEEVYETLADAAESKNISFEITSENAVMKGVRRLLYEIVYNLCDNAIKYSNPGGSVTLSAVRDDNKVLLSVKDTGIGIPVEHQDKIFERFYRVDKSHSKQSGGTGLGLSIVKHAVQYHNGTIRLESEQGKGTAVAVVFDTADCE